MKSKDLAERFVEGIDVDKVTKEVIKELRQEAENKTKGFDYADDILFVHEKMNKKWEAILYLTSLALDPHAYKRSIFTYYPNIYRDLNWEIPGLEVEPLLATE